jgi:plastocyanin
MPAGNRLRPEDSVGTDAQFEGQQAVYRRRKLIDELVSTGVPAVAADSGSSRRSQPLILLAYIVVVAVALAIAFGQKGSAEPPGGGDGGGGGGGGGLTITASNVSFDVDTLSLPADKAASVDFVNNDPSSVQHNLGIYTEEGGDELFKGDPVPGGSSTTYSIDPLKAGTYYFQCDFHPAMNGSVEVK